MCPTRLLIGAVAVVGLAASPEFKTEQIFAPEAIHNHSSSIVELPNGDLLVCWYNGSGERQADDVKIEGARLRKGESKWSARFPLFDTPGFPDTNPMLYVDKQQRLWMFWGLIVANEWHTAILKYVRSDNAFSAAGPPRWQWSSEILLKPANILERTKQYATGDKADKLIERAGDKYFARMGWFTRTHPIDLPSGRIVLPLYSDGYSYGLMGLSDDHGQTWHASEPIIGGGGVQPSVVRRRNGELVAYSRDNGPPPKRILVSTSKDDGESWTVSQDTELANPGSSVEALVLQDGRWIMVYNDTEKGRNSLAISTSDDEGKTWRWTRHIAQAGTGSFHYPSVIQTRDGRIHVTYSNFTGSKPDLQTISHAWFNTAWLVGQ